MKSDLGRAFSWLFATLLACPTSQAFEWSGVDLRGQIEAAWQYAPMRPNTLFNPQGSILNIPDQAGVFGQRLSPRYTMGPVTFRGDFWGEEIVQERNGGARFFVRSGAADWNVTDKMVVSAGVDILRWGPGYIWNPSDPFQYPELNFEDRVISYKVNGEVFASVDWTGEDGWGVSTYAVNHKLNETLYGTNGSYQPSGALKVHKQFSGSDAIFTYARIGGMNFLGGSYSATIGDKLELHGELSLRDQRHTALPEQVDIATPGGLASYYMLGRDSGSQWRAQGLVGGQYTMENMTNFILEYLYNGEGYSDEEFASLRKAAVISRAQLLTPLAPAAVNFLAGANLLFDRMGQHYLFARVSNPHVIGDLDGRVFLRYSIQDGGVIVGGLMRYSIGDNLAVMVGGQYFGGDSLSEARYIPLSFVFHSGFVFYF